MVGEIARTATRRGLFERRYYTPRGENVQGDCRKPRAREEHLFDSQESFGKVSGPRSQAMNKDKRSSQ